MDSVEKPDMLVAMLRAQRKLQEGYADGDPWLIQEREHKIAFIRQQHTNMVVEGVEALNEVGWKPWGTSRHINALSSMKELVDHWHFVINWLFVLAGELDLEDEEQLATLFTQLYFEKNGINHDRQKGDYDGFAEKCPECGREREMAVYQERMAVDTQMDYTVLVCPCGREYHD